MNCSNFEMDGSLGWYPLYTQDSDSQDIANLQEVARKHQQQSSHQQHQQHNRNVIPPQPDGGRINLLQLNVTLQRLLLEIYSL